MAGGLGPLPAPPGLAWPSATCPVLAADDGHHPLFPFLSSFLPSSSLPPHVIVSVVVAWPAGRGWSNPTGSLQGTDAGDPASRWASHQAQTKARASLVSASREGRLMVLSHSLPGRLERPGFSPHRHWFVRHRWAIGLTKAKAQPSASPAHSPPRSLLGGDLTWSAAYGDEDNEVE